VIQSRRRRIHDGGRRPGIRHRVIFSTTI
jgi:hypothetical protein